MKHRDERELEQFLDRALCGLGHETARDGLEQRILADLAVASETKTRRWWVWAAVPLCAAVILLAVLWSRPKKEVLLPQIAQTAPAAPIAARHSPPRVVTASRPKPRRREPRAAPQTAPKLPTFPSQADEAQARMLLQFVQGSPQAVEQVVSEEEQFQQLVAQNVQTPQDADEMERR